MMSPFLQLGDQKINVFHIRVLREVPAAGPDLPAGVSIDMGRPDGCWTWQPKTQAELDWFYQAVNVLGPGELPYKTLVASEALPMRTAPPRVQTPARKGGGK